MRAEYHAARARARASTTASAGDEQRDARPPRRGRPARRRRRRSAGAAAGWRPRAPASTTTRTRKTADLPPVRRGEREDAADRPARDRRPVGSPTGPPVERITDRRARAAADASAAGAACPIAAGSPTTPPGSARSPAQRPRSAAPGSAAVSLAGARRQVAQPHRPGPPARRQLLLVRAAGGAEQQLLGPGHGAVQRFGERGDQVGDRLVERAAAGTTAVASAEVAGLGRLDPPAGGAELERPRVADAASTSGLVPPRSGTSPSDDSRIANRASSATTRRSQASASWKPAPTACALHGRDRHQLGPRSQEKPAWNPAIVRVQLVVGERRQLHQRLLPRTCAGVNIARSSPAENDSPSAARPPRRDVVGRVADRGQRPPGRRRLRVAHLRPGQRDR